jgi:hypothetical protein
MGLEETDDPDDPLTLLFQLAIKMIAIYNLS